MNAFGFDSTQYGPAVAELLRTPRTPALGPGQPVRAVQAQLAALTLPPGCLSGLWLYFDFLDESHTISQDLHTSEGSFWHAIMHRREPDAWNSKYWWRKVGAHPVLKQIGKHAASLGYAYTNPLDFVDDCERVRGSDSQEEEQVKRVQLLEWQLLFDHCFHMGNR